MNRYAKSERRCFIAVSARGHRDVAIVALLTFMLFSGNLSAEGPGPLAESDGVVHHPVDSPAESELPVLFGEIKPKSDEASHERGANDSWTENKEDTESETLGIAALTGLSNTSSIHPMTEIDFSPALSDAADNSTSADVSTPTMQQGAVARGEDALIGPPGNGVDAQLRGNSVPWYRSGLAALGVVLLAILGVAALAKRVLKGTQLARSEGLHVISRTFVSPKQSIVLVQMGARLAFVGVSPQSITTLRIVRDPKEAAMLRGKSRLATQKAEQFDTLLSKETQAFVGTETSDHRSGETTSPVAEAQRDVGELLRRLRAMGKPEAGGSTA